MNADSDRYSYRDAVLEAAEGHRLTCDMPGCKLHIALEELAHHLDLIQRFNMDAGDAGELIERLQRGWVATEPNLAILNRPSGHGEAMTDRQKQQTEYLDAPDPDLLVREYPTGSTVAPPTHLPSGEAGR